jgi:hypothetical protein
MRTKATDLWNRILDLGEIDHIGYGAEEDRQAIHSWISRHPNDTEPQEYSAVYSMLNANLMFKKGQENPTTSQGSEKRRSVNYTPFQRYHPKLSEFDVR